MKHGRVCHECAALRGRLQEMQNVATYNKVATSRNPLYFPASLQVGKRNYTKARSPAYVMTNSTNTYILQLKSILIGFKLLDWN
jgi:hypothetical protein